MKNQTTIRIILTAEQQAQIELVTGKKLTTLALKPEALELRAAPGATMGN